MNENKGWDFGKVGEAKQGVDKVCPVPGRYLHLPVEVKKGRLR